MADPFAHCAAHPELTPRPDMRLVSRAEAATVPRLQPEDFASPLQSGLRYGIMSHISAQTGFSPGSSQQVQKHACVFHWQDTLKGPGCSVVRGGCFAQSCVCGEECLCTNGADLSETISKAPLSVFSRRSCQAAAACRQPVPHSMQACHHPQMGLLPRAPCW